MQPTLGALLLGLTTIGANAGSVVIHVTDTAAAPALDAVAYAEAASGQTLPKLLRPAQVEQKARRFAPLVTVIQTGSVVSFPNHDSVRHHVYSFSPSKVFELKLYSGAGGDPVIFEKAGTVVVGCNIHDQMAAYIQVVDTPYFGKTDADGNATLESLPPGKYRLKLWHPDQPAGATPTEQLLTVTTSDQTVAVALPFKTTKK
ncbi:MAG: methylamine utilization protein [Pseudomonadota bacterium]|nr:methylamine utilization protein [Pseudomonadota bacterium]